MSGKRKIGPTAPFTLGTKNQLQKLVEIGVGIFMQFFQSYLNFAMFNVRGEQNNYFESLDVTQSSSQQFSVSRIFTPSHPHVKTRESRSSGTAMLGCSSTLESAPQSCSSAKQS